VLRLALKLLAELGILSRNSNGTRI
jgi:hypothetical protein